MLLNASVLCFLKETAIDANYFFPLKYRFCRINVVPHTIKNKNCDLYVQGAKVVECSTCAFTVSILSTSKIEIAVSQMLDRSKKSQV